MAIGGVGTRDVGQVWAREVAGKAAELKASATLLFGVKNFSGPLPFALAGLSEKNFKSTLEGLERLLDTRFGKPLSQEAVATANEAFRQLDDASYMLDRVRNRGDQARIPANATVQPFKPEFSTVDVAAKALVRDASRTGKPQVYDFNGTVLVARPGQKAAAVLTEWSTARESGGVASRTKSTQHSVRQVLTDNAREAHLDALAKKPARPVQEVMADVMRAGGHPLAAGLNRLQHPQEIREFVTAIATNPPPALLQDGTRTLSLAEARDVIMDNLKFAVGRESCLPGTDASWLAGMAHARKTLNM